jgi:hypothetical protein
MLIPLALLTLLVIGIVNGHFFLFIPLAFFVLLGTRGIRYARRARRSRV